MQAAERPDQDQDRNRHAQQPEQPVAHDFLHSWFPPINARPGTWFHNPPFRRPFEPAFPPPPLPLPLPRAPARACRLEDPSSGKGRAMEVFLQQLINGITLGSIYGLIAIGYTMVFGII